MNIRWLSLVSSYVRNYVIVFIDYDDYFLHSFIYTPIVLSTLRLNP